MFGKKPKKPAQNHIYIHNKCDVNKCVGACDVSVSAKKNINIRKLKDLIYSELVSSPSPNEIMLTSKRQLSAVTKALQHLAQASLLLVDNNSLELVVEELNLCVNELDKITNKTTRDDILDNIFSSFCVGK